MRVQKAKAQFRPLEGSVEKRGKKKKSVREKLLI